MTCSDRAELVWEVSQAPSLPDDDEGFVWGKKSIDLAEKTLAEQEVKIEN